MPTSRPPVSAHDPCAASDPVPEHLLRQAATPSDYAHVWQELRVQLLRVSGCLRTQVNSLLDPFDLTQQQLQALRILRGVSPYYLTVGQLREQLLDPSSDVPRLIERLYRKGWISRKPCTQDARRTLVQLSEEGERLLQAVDMEMEKLDTLLQAVPEAAARVLNEQLALLSSELMARAKDTSTVYCSPETSVAKPSATVTALEQADAAEVVRP